MAQIQARLEDSAALRQLGLALLAVGIGIVGGLAVAVGNPVVPFVAVAAFLALPWLVTRPTADLMLVIGTLMLLPYATLPVRIAILTPTMLEIGLVLLYVSWGLRMLLNRDERVARTAVDGWLALLLGCTLFAFVLGLGRDSSPLIIHNYFKFVLAIGLFFSVNNLVRRTGQLALAMRAIMILGAAASLLGATLWLMPDALATSILSRLSIIGYPTDRVVRYIEDNPALGERAVGTQVDPNSFGGLLVVIVVITAVQLLSRKPLLPRWLLGAMLMVNVAALVMTQSRTTFLGVVAAGLFVAIARYRKLLGWGLVIAAVVALSGLGGSYFARLGSGLAFEDQANQMRLAEYRNAVDIIGRYPAFGRSGRKRDMNPRRAWTRRICRSWRAGRSLCRMPIRACATRRICFTC